MFVSFEFHLNVFGNRFYKETYQLMGKEKTLVLLYFLMLSVLYVLCILLKLFSMLLFILIIYFISGSKAL